MGCRLSKGKQVVKEVRRSWYGLPTEQGIQVVKEVRRIWYWLLTEQGETGRIGKLERGSPRLVAGSLSARTPVDPRARRC